LAKAGMILLQYLHSFSFIQEKGTLPALPAIWFI
jgi:hypothetical protein